ncbi:MAG: SDR family NAD(P)-dependent oxidoreductase [Burkholderiaceae bacterium]
MAAIDAWGMFQGRDGEVARRFTVVMDAKWDGDTGVLDEAFQWSDGTRSRRVWTLRRQPDGSYRGTADDVVGEAIGQVSGNAFHWRYVMALPVDGKVYNVNFDDWMFLIDDRVMLNRAAMSKWGFHLGDVTLSFTKSVPTEVRNRWRQDKQEPRRHEPQNQRLVGQTRVAGGGLGGHRCGAGPRLGGQGARLALSSRKRSSLEALNIEGALLLPCDGTSPTRSLPRRRPWWPPWGVDLVVYMAGGYEPMQADTLDVGVLERVVDVNFHGAVRLTAAVLPELKAGGGLALVASVAGYQGLPKSLAYGPGKAALIHFAECLHMDLAGKGVGVWVINPGFVSTRLTAKNDFKMPALISPEQAAQDILAGFASGGFEIHFPKRFTRLLKGLSLLPYRLYFPLVRKMTGG